MKFKNIFNKASHNKEFAKFSLRFSSMVITLHVHATENKERVLQVVTTRLGLNKNAFSHVTLQGHYKNPIMRVTAHLIGEEADRFSKNMFSLLTEFDKQQLRGELSNHLDKHGAFYLRISKQQLFSENIELSQIDAVSLKIKPSKPIPKDIHQWYDAILR